MTTTRHLALAIAVSATLLSVLTGCTSARRANYAAAVAAERPPDDFWLSVTVLRAPADTASRAAAYLRTPVATRPARYIVEADRILRAAVGSGATMETFPDETRQLTEAEFDGLWTTLRGSSLVREDHAAMVGMAPSAASIGGKTMYVVAFSAGGDRRVLLIEAEPAPGDGAADAGKLVEQLAALAWMH